MKPSKYPESMGNRSRVGFSGNDLRQPCKFYWLLQRGKPRLRSEAEENGEGARIPLCKGLIKRRARAC